MKFGRFQGILLIVLGLLFWAGQAVVSLRQSAPPERGNDVANANPPKIWPIFGIMGGIVVSVGLALVITNRVNSSEEELKNGNKKKLPDP